MVSRPAAAAGVTDTAIGATLRWRLAGHAEVLATGTSAGDLSPGAPGAADRRRRLVGVPWTVPRQVHGAGVLVVERPGEHDGDVADAVVTGCRGAAVAVVTADCAPVALASPEGVVGVAHAGWKGLEAGVLPATVAAMRALGATDVDAVLGPCVHPECYAFGPADLDRLARGLGPTVRATDSTGAPALDVPAAVAASLEASGARLVADAGVCTACSGGHWSWRARADSGRQATVVWRP